MSTDLSAGRRAEIERRERTDAIAVELCKVFRERMSAARKHGDGEIAMRLDTLKNITDSIEALNIRCNQLEAQRQGAERERDLLAETARRLTGERDNAERERDRLAELLEGAEMIGGREMERADAAKHMLDEVTAARDRLLDVFGEWEMGLLTDGAMMRLVRALDAARTAAAPARTGEAE